MARVLIVIVCGVSGVGKTTVGRLLAEAMACPFYDADDFHSAGNIEKMKRGEPLSDVDRDPWIDRLASLVREYRDRGESAVLACSALRAAHRRRLGVDQQHVKTVFLDGSFEQVRDHLTRRNHAFMPAALLESQFDALERPEDGIVVTIDESPETLCASLVDLLGAT